MQIGPNYLGNGTCEFTIWAPLIDQCEIKVLHSPERKIKLQKDQSGYFRKVIEDIDPGTKYFIEIFGKNYPDPVSNYQPEGVHGPSEVIDHKGYVWKYIDYEHAEMKDLLIYELHIGTFTQEGTFKSAAQKLGHLVELGITAIEIMPVSQFPGDRNWGYDGVLPFAPQNTYGRPEDMKYFIDECHKNDINVILDIVYNHFGPEGNYLRNFGPYFTPHYKTPWGDAINFDGEYSDNVRNYFLENAVYWLKVYNLDGLRLDAIDHIYDMGAKHFLSELSELVEGLNIKGDKKFIIAESDLNDTKVIRPLNENGYGCKAQWNDDFHHSIHPLLTGENNGYYKDFGRISHLVSAYNEGFVYSGKYSGYRKRRHGSNAAGILSDKFIVCTQNHDQVGNRAFGRRLTKLVPFEALKLAAGAVILSPYIPLFFMGEEYGEENPFIYFISHQDPELVNAVRDGRINEFSAFEWKGEIPDPFSIVSFDQSKLNWNLMNEKKHKVIFELYKQLISCRKSKPALNSVNKNNLEATGEEESKLLLLHRWSSQNKIFVIFNFNKETVTKLLNVPAGKWNKFIDSASEIWMGQGTSTPDHLLAVQQNITIKGLSFSAYETGTRL